MRKVLILVFVLVALGGCCAHGPFINAADKYHKSSSKLIEDYIIDEKPIPAALKTPQAKADLKETQDKFKAAVEAEQE